MHERNPLSEDLPENFDLWDHFTQTSAARNVVGEEADIAYTPGQDGEGDSYLINLPDDTKEQAED